MKYIKTKYGETYKVVHENAGFEMNHYVCSTLYSYNIHVKCGSEEKTINDVHALVFVDKSDAIEEWEED